MNFTPILPHQNKRSKLSNFFYICIPLSASLILFSCSGGSTGPDDNSNGPENGGGGGTSIGTAPTFENVGKILVSSCGSCHGSQLQESGVRLDSYENVINSVGVQYNKKIVDPGSAETSPLIEKIESNPDIGERMPLNGTPLTSERIDQIRTWINNGAEND